MNSTSPKIAQRRQALQERMLRNRNLLGKAESVPTWQPRNIL